MSSSVLLLALVLQQPAPPSDSVPLYTNLGDHHYAITTDVPAAQAYFDQGLRLYYAFNHQEAIRSFREAQRLDPACAMCFWGEALAWGPNINMPMDSAAGVAAFAAVRRAQAALDDETAVERALVAAQAVRYAAAPPADRAPLDSAYARAMAETVRDHPDDLEAAVLSAESLMDLRPWNYWTADGKPQPGMREAFSRLARVIAADPKHPGGCHFYIHAIEAEYPDSAVACAERLAGLMPGAGHLVHMPAHIYVRVGRYADAIHANEHAVHADETYIRDRHPGPGVYTGLYYPHNYDFMAFAASMAGQGDLAVASADRIPTLAPQEMLHDPSAAFLQHWTTRPLQMRVRFARWDEILATPAPPPDLRHAAGIWHYARGRALAAKGDVAAADSELALVRAAARDPALDGVRMDANESHLILSIAADVLAGRVAAARGDFDAAVERLQAAAALEDSMLYTEPLEWSIPVREELGEVLLQADRPLEAERAFRSDLERFRENGWSLHGLARALRQQGKNAEADVVQARYDKAFAGADAVVKRRLQGTPGG